MSAQRYFLIPGAILLLVLFMTTAMPGMVAAEKWIGTDGLIEHKIVELGGPEAKEPLFNTDQGDLLLFFFALGGFAAGIIVGYNWHRLFGAGGGKQV